MVENSESYYSSRDTISLKAISLIITGMETLLTNTHRRIALAEIRGVLEV
jgi:hypothetical protein